MKEKLNKSQSVSLLKKLTDAETVVNYKGDFVEMNVIGKLNQKKEQEISLKSIYELMITKFNSIDALIIKNQEDNNERFNSIDALIIKNQEDNNERFNSIDTRLSSLETKVIALDGEIKAVKKDVKNLDAKVTDLDTKVIALDAKVTTLDTTVQKLDTKLNKVIELNKDIINLNKLKVSKENKTWLFVNGHDDNTPPR